MVTLNNFQLWAIVCMLLLRPLLLVFFLNKCNTLTLLMIIQVQTIGVRGLLLPCSLEVKVLVFWFFFFVLFPYNSCAFTFEDENFLLLSVWESSLFLKYVKPLKQHNISFFLMFGFTFRLSKQSHRTAVRGCLRAQRCTVFYHITEQ